MKVAIYHNLPSGGALLHLSAVARALKTSGHSIDLYTPTCAEKEFCSFLDIVDHHHELERDLWKPKFPLLNPMLYKSYLKNMISHDRNFSDLILRERYDGIYMGQCRIWTEPPLLRHLQGKLKTLLYCQEPKRSFYEERYLKQIEAWPLWKKLWRLPTIRWMKACQQDHIAAADKVLCNSLFSKSNIEKAYPGINPEVSYIGTDTDNFSPGPSNIKEDLLTSVGALDPSKNHQMAIEVAGLKPAGRKFKVCIVTDRSYGETAESLKALAQNLEVELEIKVRVPPQELAEIHRKSFAVVYCPLMEPFGLVSIEAQASGTPVLGRNEGGLKETIVENVSGHLLMDNPKDYAQKLEHWIHDPQAYETLCQSARQHVLDHWDQKNLLAETVKKIEELFSSK